MNNITIPKSEYERLKKIEFDYNRETENSFAAWWARANGMGAAVPDDMNIRDHYRTHLR